MLTRFIIDHLHPVWREQSLKSVWREIYFSQKKTIFLTCWTAPWNRRVPLLFACLPLPTSTRRFDSSKKSISEIGFESKPISQKAVFWFSHPCISHLHIASFHFFSITISLSSVIPVTFSHGRTLFMLTVVSSTSPRSSYYYFPYFIPNFSVTLFLSSTYFNLSRRNDFQLSVHIHVSLLPLFEYLSSVMWIILIHFESIYLHRLHFPPLCTHSLYLSLISFLTYFLFKEWEYSLTTHSVISIISFFLSLLYLSLPRFLFLLSSPP